MYLAIFELPDDHSALQPKSQTVKDAAKESGLEFTEMPLSKVGPDDVD